MSTTHNTSIMATITTTKTTTYINSKKHAATWYGNYCSLIIFSMIIVIFKTINKCCYVLSFKKPVA